MLRRAIRLTLDWPLTAALSAMSALALLSLFLLSPGQAPQPPAYSLSLTDLEVKTGFPKWGRVLDRAWSHDAALAEECDERLGRPCRLETWQRFLERVKEDPFVDRIAAINRFVNSVAYREDREVWGASDYWAGPGEFFARGGDCEDFAIAKYYSLRAIGVPAERMSIVVLKDTRRQIAHAVLTVRWAGPELVLDNLSDDARVWPDLPHYQPIYSVNESSYEIVHSPTLARLFQSAGS